MYVPLSQQTSRILSGRCVCACKKSYAPQTRTHKVKNTMDFCGQRRTYVLMHMLAGDSNKQSRTDRHMLHACTPRYIRVFVHLIITQTSKTTNTQRVRGFRFAHAHHNNAYRSLQRFKASLRCSESICMDWIISIFFYMHALTHTGLQHAPLAAQGTSHKVPPTSVHQTSLEAENVVGILDTSEFPSLECARASSQKMHASFYCSRRATWIDVCEPFLCELRSAMHRPQRTLPLSHPYLRSA
jgi:hypothetical protein